MCYGKSNVVPTITGGTEPYQYTVIVHSSFLPFINGYAVEWTHNNH